MDSSVVIPCPYCDSKIILQLPIIDLYIYIKKINNNPSINISKTFNSSDENKEFIKHLLVNSLKKKPFYSRIIITKSYHNAIQELTKIGYIKPEDLKELNIYY